MTCCAYYDKNNNCVETYLQHIYCMNLVWDKIKKYYMKNLARVLGKNVDVDRLMRIAFLAHDAGKLLQAYLNKRGSFQYRHEIVGAYVSKELTNAINNDYVSNVIATAVLLHHEGIILSAYAGKYNERIIPLSTIKKVIEISDFTYICNDLMQDPYYEKVKKYYTDEINLMDSIMRKIDKNRVYDTIKDIISFTIVEGLKFRNKVASVLHLLSVVDSVSATLDRGNNEEDAGTQISRLALNGAELIKGVKCK